MFFGLGFFGMRELRAQLGFSPEIHFLPTACSGPEVAKDRVVPIQ